MAKLISLQDAADITGLSAAHVRRLAGAGKIEGAELREREGARGRWYIPRRWAESRRGNGRAVGPTKAERIADALRADPDATNSAIARRVGCDPSYVSRLRAAAEVEPEAPPLVEQAPEPSTPAPAPLAGLAFYRREGLPGELVAMAQNGRAWRVPDRLGGWADRVELTALPAARTMRRLATRDEERARVRLDGGP